MPVTNPVIKKFEPRELGPKLWGTETLVACTDTYMGKVLRMRAGESGPFQYHERKDETFYLYAGIARVTSKTAEGVNRMVKMYSGDSFHVPPGAPHKVEALQECVFFETSTPVFEDRVSVE